MKRILFTVVVLLVAFAAFSQSPIFRFAFLSDTHIGSPNGAAEEDLRRTVRDINAMEGIAFVVLTGDITELGTDEELKLAKQILDSLDIPYYIIPGNHDSGWSESGGEGFTTVFGYDKFCFEYQGVKFFGCPSGPYVRMSDGHIPRSSIIWVDSIIAATPKSQPVVFLNHYPIDNGLDNWYEVIDRLKTVNTIAILCGHGHANRAMNFEGIPGVMGRSNLRARAALGGYNIVDFGPDSIIFRQKRPGIDSLRRWTSVKIEKHDFDKAKVFARPDYSVNDKYKQVEAEWIFSSDANIISTPEVINDMVVFGNQAGTLQSVSLKTGKKNWSFSNAGAIFSSPAGAEGRIVFGSADGNIYCLDQKGKEKWKLKTGAAVLGSPLIENKTVYIGGSDGSFRAIDLLTGRELWNFNELDGPVVSVPLIYEGRVIFGAWDRNLYALDQSTGKKLWSWNNGSTIRNYSPASCIPVAKDGVVYVVAPDRYISAIDASTGETLWRNNDATVRESIGISEDGKMVYGKTMQDTIVAYATSREKQSAAWKMHCGFGYEHVPSMLIENEGKVFFGTKNGVVYCIDPDKKSVEWLFKIDNSMVNTIRIVDNKRLIASTMDGKVALLEFKNE